MATKEISFENKEGLTLRGFIHIPSTKKRNGKAIVYLHGFPGDCEGSAFRFGSRLEKKGYVFLRFDFSGSNKSDGKFCDKLMSKEISDTKCAIDFLFEKYSELFDELILCGLSTGAIDASLYAHKDKRVSKLVLMGAVSNLKHAVHYDFNGVQVRDFWRKGYIKYDMEYFKDDWVYGKKINKTFYDEFFTLDIPKAISKWQGPTLILHGEDEAIPSKKDPHELFKLLCKPKKLVIVKKAGHSFKGFEDKVAGLIDGFCKKKF